MRYRIAWETFNKPAITGFGEWQERPKAVMERIAKKQNREWKMVIYHWVEEETENEKTNVAETRA